MGFLALNFFFLLFWCGKETSSPSTLSKIMHQPYHRSGRFRDSQTPACNGLLLPMRSPLVIRDWVARGPHTCQVSMKFSFFPLLSLKGKVTRSHYGITGAGAWSVKWVWVERSSLLCFLLLVFFFLLFCVPEGTRSTRRLCAMPRPRAGGPCKQGDPPPGIKISLILKWVGDSHIRD